MAKLSATGMQCCVSQIYRLLSDQFASFRIFSAVRDALREPAQIITNWKCVVWNEKSIPLPHCCLLRLTLV